MCWIGCLRELAHSSLGEQFLRFSQNYLSWFNHIFLLFDKRNLAFFRLIFLLRSIKVYLCPNIINFDSVDFCERRPEEVICLFWCSVYFASYVSHFLRNQDYGRNYRIKVKIKFFYSDRSSFLWTLREQFAFEHTDPYLNKLTRKTRYTNA